MSLNPAAKRLVSRYSKLSQADKDSFLERTAFNYKDSRCVRSLVDWAAESNLPAFLEKFLSDAHSSNNADLIDYVVERIYHNKKTLGAQGATLFHAWVGVSHFDCEDACSKSIGGYDLKWIHNLIPHIENPEIRYLAYSAVVNFCAYVSMNTGFSHPEQIIQPYYDGLAACLSADDQCSNMISRLNTECQTSLFLETLNCAVQKQRLQLHVGEGAVSMTSRKI